jgi:hypothetical protein
MQGKLMAFPVRFVAEGQTVQTTSRALDEEWVFVRCVEPPMPGERVVLRLYLPGIATGDAINAVVDEIDGDGFRARFIELDPTAREHVRAALRAGQQVRSVAIEPTKVGENRRTLRRYLDRFRVTLGDADQRQVSNLSGTGVFIETDSPPELDQIVQLYLELPDGRKPARVQAIVMRRVLPGVGVPGAGVQFISGDDDFRERLDAYLETLG